MPPLPAYAAMHRKDSPQDFAETIEGDARSYITKADEMNDAAAMLHALTMRLGTDHLLGPELKAIVAGRIALEDAAAALHKQARQLRNGR